MSSSLYDSTILQSKACFLTLKHILTVAEQNPSTARFPGARLCDDMKPLTFQIYSASNHCEKLIARLTGREWTLWEDDLTGFADMHERIAIILDRLARVEREAADSQGPVTKSTAWGPNGNNVTVMTGEAFAHGFEMPNIFFHVSMAYAILRKEGVPLGKKDFMINFVMEHVPLALVPS